MAGINDIDSSIQNLIKMTNSKAVLVKAYENPSVSSSFPSQKLPMDLSDCDLVAVIGVTDTSSNTRLVPPIVTKVGLGGIYVNAGGSRRYFRVYEDGINFDAVYPASATGDCIPYLVYRIKLSGGGYGLRRIFSALKHFLAALQGGVCYGK